MLEGWLNLIIIRRIFDRNRGLINVDANRIDKEPDKVEVYPVWIIIVFKPWNKIDNKSTSIQTNLSAKEQNSILRSMP